MAAREAVELGCTDLVVDVRVFARALDEGDPVRALESCGGPILEEFDEEWAIEARDEHAQRVGEALEQAAAAAEDPG